MRCSTAVRLEISEVPAVHEVAIGICAIGWLLVFFA
jgi:hypothetical protein